MQFLKRAVVEFLKLFGHSGVCLIVAEECVVSQNRQNAALGMKNRILNLGFVIGFAYSGRQDDYPIVAGHVSIGWVDVRIIVMGFSDTCFQIVWHHYDRCPTKKLESQTVTQNPVLLFHLGEHMCKNVVAGP